MMNETVQNAVTSWSFGDNLVRSSDLYTLYLNSTEGDVLKEFTFKNRFEMMFPLRHLRDKKR